MSHKISDEDYFIHFWSQVDRSGGPRSCWEWQGGKKAEGYGAAVHFGLQGAHRIAWYYAHGHPGQMYVLHNCDNPACCNPRHLRLGTHLDNMRDMVERGRQMWQPFSNAQAEKLGEQYQALVSVAVETVENGGAKRHLYEPYSLLRSRGYIEGSYVGRGKADVRITPKGLLSLVILTAAAYMETAA
jgi:hypothetical protein